MMLVNGVLLTTALLVGMATVSYAFHDGGAGMCVGCHSLHGTDIVSPGGPSLLREQDASSTCLYCHQRSGDSSPTTYHISTPANELPLGAPPKQLTPGGDFGWLKKTYSWTPGPSLPMAYSQGERHGHNTWQPTSCMMPTAPMPWPRAEPILRTACPASAATTPMGPTGGTATDR